VNAETGHLLWKQPVGEHNGHGITAIRSQSKQAPVAWPAPDPEGRSLARADIPRSGELGRFDGFPIGRGP
jgi:hypothetical protein